MGKSEIWKSIVVKLICGVVLVVGATFAALRWGLPDNHDFDDVTKVIELGVLGLGLLSLMLIWEQTRLTAKWNKLLSYHQFFGELITPEIVEKVRAVVRKHGFEAAMLETTAMPTASVDQLCHVDNATDKATISAYLDDFEEFCGAVHAGVTDEGYAYTLEATRVIRVWTVYGPFIRRMRGSNPYTRCYLELERLGRTWEARRQRELEEQYAKEGVRNHV